MKTALALALLLSVAPLAASAADAEFDPKEKISIDLRDAKIADLVTTLGALANLPVYIDPDVSGLITIKLVDVPFEKVLTLINVKTGVSVRIENGKLVASRSAESFLAAVTLPDQYKSASRLRVAEVSKATPSAPLFVRTKLNGASSCHRLEFVDGERPTITFPVAENEGAPRLSVTQFGFDPVSGLRYLALDGAELSGAVAVGGRKAVAKLESESTSLIVLVGEKGEGSCPDATLREVPPSRPLQLFFSTREIESDGPGVRVMSPNVSLTTGTTFKLRTGLKDERAGQQRELVLSGYLSPHGHWVAVHLMATAIWIDPADGIEYFYTQSGEVALVPVTLKGVVAATIPAGVATPKALELTVLGPDEKGGPTAPPLQNEAKD